MFAFKNNTLLLSIQMGCTSLKFLLHLSIKNTFLSMNVHVLYDNCVLMYKRVQTMLCLKS